MDERRLRAAAGLSLIGQHAVLLVYVAVLGAQDRFTTDEMFTTFGLIGPLFAAYATASVRRLLQQQEHDIPRPVAWERGLLILLLPTVFFAVIAVSISWKAFGSLTFDAFVKLVGAAETFVGVYVGMVVEQLFGLPAREHGGKPTTRAATTT